MKPSSTRLHSSSCIAKQRQQLLLPQRTRVIQFATLAYLLTNVCYAIKRCPSSQGGGVCPHHNNCCPLPKKTNQHQQQQQQFESGCVTFNHNDNPGVCCDDDDDDDDDDQLDYYGTACASGFVCAQSSSSSSSSSHHFNSTQDVDRRYYCEELKSTADHPGDETHGRTQPRYKLFPASERSLGQMHGFRVTTGMNSNEEVDITTADDDDEDGNSEHILAYYSTIGSINVPNPTIDSKLEALLIVIHGSGRTADDYLYSGMVASKLQTTYPSANVLVLAPRFLAKEDGDIYVPVPSSSQTTKDPEQQQNSSSMRRPMKWNVTDPIAHAWRYGANALPPSHDVSSYDAVDALVEYFSVRSGPGRRFANMKEIIVIGHSAGGQFTHRWALLSSIPAWGDGFENSNSAMAGNEYADAVSIVQETPAIMRRRRLATVQKADRPTNAKLPSIRVVVANPRSFCYLDGRRFVNGTFELPPQTRIESCPNYNKWEWGLDDGGELPTPYRDTAIERMGGNRTKLAHRYSTRNVLYVSGRNDTEKLRRSCEADEFQGAYRRQRSEYFFSSLYEYFGKQIHQRFVVDDVGHDHALLFESPQGIHAMFGQEGV